MENWIVSCQKELLWPDQLSPDALRRTEAFFISLQYAAEGYINLSATKTATVYRLLGNAPKSHE